MTSLVKIVKMSKCFNKRFLIFRSIHVTQAANLYSPNALGIDGYEYTRKAVQENFANFTDNFRSKMKDFTSEPKNMIFTEDLKNMVHMAETGDVDLVLNMVKKYNNQNTQYRFGSYVLGPVVMRMFHFLNVPKAALQCFEEPSNSSFFDQLTSYQILLDLLFNHAMYDEMYRVFEKLQEKQLNGIKYPKYPVILVLAACYKQNTPKSMEYASKLWTDIISSGIVPLRRAASLLAALALKQGAPHVALEIISMQTQTYVAVRNIKAVALADMGRLDDTLMVLKTVLEKDNNQMKHTFFEETISKVRSDIEKKDNSYLREFENIEKMLRERDLINNQTVEALVLSEISIMNKSSRKSEGVHTNLSRPRYKNREVIIRNMA